MIELQGIGRFAAVLFDNDGVLVDSLAQVDECWGGICDRYGLDRAEVFAVLHGRPAIETLSQFLSGEPLQRANTELERLEIDTAVATVALPGALDLISALTERELPFTIATSATRELALARLSAAGIPIPELLVCADDVRQGKPAPDPYLLGAQRLGADPARCLVVEDAPSGIAAGLAAGATVVAVRNERHPTDVDGAHHVIGSLTEILAALV